MASLIQGFEYDIFISYRHNDNRSGWATGFVEALKEELAGVIKDPVSVYFDKNLNDGLLETYDVDKSLAGKLKCLIFIPILSQTYCDQKAFAWKHEFCVFNRLAKSDQFGRDIRLGHGNVASRILAIKIHDLDAEDRALIETEIGGVLRPIEFIYKEPGVIRALKSSDLRSENQNKTDYANQINKVANAVKELLHAIHFPADSGQPPVGRPFVIQARKKKTFGIVAALVLCAATAVFGAFHLGWFGNSLEAPEHSIAVLPFENMTKDPEQEYFSSGMTEDILTHLSKISDLQVKSRTSILQYKGTTKTISEIGQELAVANVVEGSVRKVGDKIRVVVQLIDAKRDIHLWSETYDRDFKDILEIQTQIAIEITNALEAKLTPTERKEIEKEQDHDVTAYDFYLRAREEFNHIKFSKPEVNRLMSMLDKAIAIDPGFAKAHALKARSWLEYTAFGPSEKTWMDSALFSADKAISLEPEAPDGYVVKAWLYEFVGAFSKSEEYIKKAYELAPRDIDTRSSYGRYLLTQRDEKGADLMLRSIAEGYTSKQSGYYYGMFGPYYLAGDSEHALKILDRLITLEPDNGFAYTWAAAMLNETGQHEKARLYSDALLKINPDLSFNVDAAAWTSFYQQDYQKAAALWGRYKEIESNFEDKTQTVPFRHRLAMVYQKLGRNAEAKTLLEEERKRQTEMIVGMRGRGAWGNRGALFYDLAVSQALLGDNNNAIQNLDSAFKYRLHFRHLYANDPAFSAIKHTPAFKKVQAKIDDFFSFRKRAFSNALSRARASKELSDMSER